MLMAPRSARASCNFYPPGEHVGSCRLFSVGNIQLATDALVTDQCTRDNRSIKIYSLRLQYAPDVQICTTTIIIIRRETSRRPVAQAQGSGSTVRPPG